ncbi:MAG TPA: hypothetical protein VKE88_03045 [Candidatus Nanoarchaeia archaeon]|nr:hypothetical protein [Candidatus Nanoarchaeia archaeon]
MAASKVLAKVQGRIGLERHVGSTGHLESRWQRGDDSNYVRSLPELLSDTTALIEEIFEQKRREKYGPKYKKNYDKSYR